MCPAIDDDRDRSDSLSATHLRNLHDGIVIFNQENVISLEITFILIIFVLCNAICNSLY